jgi:hypothetical protein
LNPSETIEDLYEGSWRTLFTIEGGIYNFTIVATDSAGNEARSKPQQVVIPIDDEGPVVTNIKVEPTHPEEAGIPIDLSAYVIDHLAGVYDVRATITKPGFEATVFMLDPDNDGIYTGIWRTMVFTESGSYNFSIRAADRRGNIAVVDGPNIVIPEIPVDEEGPVITNIAVNPTHPEEPGIPINISAHVFDMLSAVRDVRCTLSKLEEAELTVFMLDRDSDGIYTGVWQPIFTASGIYNLTIVATDTEGNVATAKAPSVVIPVDEEGPAITNVQAMPTSGPPGTPINISAYVIDKSAIRDVRAFANKGNEQVRTIFMSPSEQEGVYTGVWNTMFFAEPGIYTIDIRANDRWGNEGSAINAVEIQLI